MTEHIFHSPHPAPEIPALSITEYVFRGLDLAADRPIFTEAATGRGITGAEAKEQIAALAGGLIARGLQKGQVAALMAPNSIDYFLTLHAVAYAGGVPTLLNPSYTTAELAHQLGLTEARFVIADPGLHRQIAAACGDVEILTMGDTSLLGTPLPQQVPVDLANDLGAIPFSSGTTGLPKGVMLTHQNLVTNAALWSHTRGVGPADVTPSFLPFIHIFGLTLMQIVYPGAGGHVHLMQRFDLERFLELTQDTRTQRLWVVPPIAIQLAKNPIVDNYDLSSIREVGSGAAPLSQEIGKMICDRLGCAFYQGYGMTEVAGVASAHTPESAAGDSLGAGIAGSEWRVVDPETGRDQGVDGVGELWIRGKMVMKGYLANAEATAETIAPGGWLRTGDIGSIDANGFVRIHDRLKELIKVKGFQVAPAEVEAALITHPAIAEAAVIGVPDEEAGEVPMGFVTFAPGASLTLAEVQAYLSNSLAKYKNIQRLEVVDSIPRAASGKILRRELRKAYT